MGMMQNKKKRDRIGVVLYTLYLLLLAGALLIILRIIGIQLWFHPDEKITEALTPPVTKSIIDPERGNIIDCEGRLLALTTPTYQIYMDCTVLKNEIETRRKNRIERADGDQERISAANADAEKSEAEWLAKARELSVELARVFPGKTADQFYQTIREGRAQNRKYVKIGTPVDRNLRNEIMEFPLFREGRYKSGLILERDFVRKYPYGKLARRTIGFVRNNKSDVANTHIGLEGKFDHILHGTNGVEYLRATDNGRMRDNDSIFVKAIDGQDVRTTINIDYQYLADNALRAEIENEEDIYGACLVLMDVKTGAIRAMVNLVRDDAGNGPFEEIQNLAIGRKGEPGSVFKTVTLMSVLNDGFIKSLEETLPATNGHVDGTSINDDHIPSFVASHGGVKEISIIDGFKISSNYVFATLAVKHYGKHGDRDDTQRFLQNIYTYKLGEAYDFDLDGMLTPTIPSPASRYWTNTDLGSIGFGYSTEETPMHILTFYNAIANKGRMMKPYLVEDIEKNGVVTDRRGPSVLNSAICSKAVADTITRALKAVTEEGTAKRLKNARCSVAGKTGTSFGTFESGAYSDEAGRRKYQGTFVGFFPSDDPRYSVICSVYSKPTNRQFQGGGIPARAIKTLIDGLYNIDPGFQPVLEKKK